MEPAIALLEVALGEYDAHIEMMCEMRARLAGELALARLHQAAVEQPAPEVRGHVELSDAALLGAPICLASVR